MFRRKDESATDSTLPNTPGASSAMPTGQMPGGSMQGPETIMPPSAQQPMQQSSNATGHISYAPVGSSRPAAPAQSAAPSEPAARQSSQPAGNYRPAPMGEFNRGASRPAGEALRSAPAQATAFGSAVGSDRSQQSGAKTSRRVLTVGNDILLKGEIATCDRLVIEGRVEAKLSEVHTVEIAESGSFKGTAEVEDAEISGVFEGDLIVRNRLVIYTSGEVRGNISYGEIEIERGGRMMGQIKTGGAGAPGKARGYEGEPAKRSSKETAAA